MSGILVSGVLVSGVVVSGVLVSGLLVSGLLVSGILPTLGGAMSKIEAHVNQVPDCKEMLSEQCWSSRVAS